MPWIMIYYKSEDEMKRQEKRVDKLKPKRYTQYRMPIYREALDRGLKEMEKK